jgi:hypothetical protein
VTTFFGDPLRKDFSERATNNNRIESIQACNEITEVMCRRVINSITVHVEEVARHNGGHIEHLIHRG